MKKYKRSTNAEDALFWYKAASSYNFRIGSDRLWLYHRDNYDKNHDERALRERKAKRNAGVVRKLN